MNGEAFCGRMFLAVAVCVVGASGTQAQPNGSASADCLVVQFAENGERIAFPAGDAYCAKLLSLRTDFDRLSRAAGFSDGELILALNGGNEVNGYFSAPYVIVTRGYLAGNLSPQTIQTTLAHEIGHGVQDRGPERVESEALWARLQASGRWEVKQEWLAFSRRYEAQADAIGQELMARAGYPPMNNRRGTEALFGCQGAASVSESASAHPSFAHRLINLTLAHTLLSDPSKVGTAMNGGEGRFFDGNSAPRGDPRSLPRSNVPIPYQQAVGLGDFDAGGRLLPGRLASAGMRVPLPPPGAGAVRETLQHAVVSAVDYWVAEPFRAAVDHVAKAVPVGRRVLEACGTPLAAKLAEDFGVWGWSRRIAENAARRSMAWASRSQAE